MYIHLLMLLGLVEGGFKLVTDGLNLREKVLALDLLPHDVKALRRLETVDERRHFLALKEPGPLSRLEAVKTEDTLTVIESLNRNQLKALEDIEPMWRIEALEAFVEIRGKREHFAVCFYNERKEQVFLYWDDGKDGVANGNIMAKESILINTYNSHKFFITNKRGKRLIEFEALESRYLYQVPSDRAMTAKEAEEALWKQEYFQRTGRQWINVWPRDPPIWPYVASDYIGQIHMHWSNVSFLEDCPTELEKGEIDEATGLNAPCEAKQSPVFYTEVVCLDPPIHVMRSDLMSDWERRAIIGKARPKMKSSVVGVGGDKDDGRTSKNTWLQRWDHEAVDRVIRRVADIVKIPESHMYMNKSSESLQVVHYEVGQHYNNHVDYGTTEYKNRFITFLLYLNDVDEGGSTGFIKPARNCPKDIHPGTRRGLWFYNLMPDGNVDAHTMHTGRHPLSGEKWLCNLWIWDPHF